MIEAFLEVLKRVTIFVVIGKIILNLGMGKGYEKYTKIVIGFMVIVQLWAGINSAVNTLKEGKLWEKERGFYSSWEKEMKTFEKDLRSQQEDIERTWREYGEEEARKWEEREKDKEEDKGIKIEKIQIGKAMEDERTSFTENKNFLFTKG